MATEISKITEDMLIGKGVTGLPDAPELSTLAMQEKFDELSIDVIIPHINQMCDEIDEAIDGAKSIAHEEVVAEQTRATGIEKDIKAGYECLSGVTEITSAHKSLNYYTTPGNYYKKDQTFSVTNCPLDLYTDTAMFRMKVSKVSDEHYMQTIYDTNNTFKYASRWYIFDDETQDWVWGAWCTLANKNGYLDQFSSVTFSDIQFGQVLMSSGTNRYLENAYLKDCMYDETHTLSDIIEMLVQN